MDELPCSEDLDPKMIKPLFDAAKEFSKDYHDGPYSITCAAVLTPCCSQIFASSPMMKRSNTSYEA